MMFHQIALKKRAFNRVEWSSKTQVKLKKSIQDRWDGLSFMIMMMMMPHQIACMEIYLT